MASLADCIEMPVTSVRPTEGLTANPDGENPLTAPSRPLSKFRYFVVLLSMALATPSEPGLLGDEAKMGSPGCVTSVGKVVPRSSTSAICMQQPLGVVRVALTVQR